MKVTLEKRADRTEEILHDLSIHRTKRIRRISYYKTPKLERPANVNDKDFAPCEVGFTWKRDRETVPEDRLEADTDLTKGEKLPAELSLGNSVWFRLEFSVPNEMQGRPVYLKFSARPIETDQVGLSFLSFSRPRMEALCYKDGEPWQAFDEGHSEILLTKEANGGETFDLLVEVGTTSLWGGLAASKFRLESGEICSKRPNVKKLYWNFKLLNDFRKDVNEDSPLYKKLLRSLNQADKTFPIQSDDDDELAAGALRALGALDSVKEESSELSSFKLTTIGHAHIDLAWLWPWSETVRKSGRTFSTALKLMEEFPSFRFLQSQPHLYEFAKNRYPSLFRRIKEKVDEGNWEPVGALWVESDVNVPGPEGLARQYLFGKRYFRREFGIDPKITFIPDVFGYSPSLPGISNAADCPYFFTQKMCWSERNEIPYHSFRWEGIDGSDVITQFLPTNTYNGEVTVEEVNKTVRNFKEADVIPEIPYLIGWGDGGGGPTREMIEKMEVMNQIDGLPELEFGSLREVFSRLESYKNDLGRWVGELYLERHRGTLTSQAKTKKNNRKAEYALREAEIWSSFVTSEKDDFIYPGEELTEAWKIVLFNQFHDVLPGSSITEVYADTDRDYKKVFKITSDVIKESINNLSELSDKGRPNDDYILVTNSLSWNRTSPVNLDVDIGDNNAVKSNDGEIYPIQETSATGKKAVFIGEDLPPLGLKTYELTTEDVQPDNEFSINEKKIENSKIRVEFDNNGLITSITDKDLDREVLTGEGGNDLRLYRDIAVRKNQDAWDIDEDVYDKWNRLPSPQTIEVAEAGPVRAVLRQERVFNNSKLTQDIILYKDSKRIDFTTDVDWEENEKLLKVHFPINVHTNEATFEVQFGHYKRDTHNNTSWDKARFETAHQKWVDVSEFRYGAALLNDCKYGVNVDGSDINLSLLRATSSPDPVADRGNHAFTKTCRGSPRACPGEESAGFCPAVNREIILDRVWYYL